MLVISTCTQCTAFGGGGGTGGICLPCYSLPCLFSSLCHSHPARIVPLISYNLNSAPLEEISQYSAGWLPWCSIHSCLCVTKGCTLNLRVPHSRSKRAWLNAPLCFAKGGLNILLEVINQRVRTKLALYRKMPIPHTVATSTCCN